LHVEASGRIVVAGNLVNALAELGVGIGREAGADALVRGRERVAAILTQVVAAGRDAEVHAAPVAQDRMHAEPTVAGLPFAGVLVVADAAHHFPGVATIVAAKERRRLDAAPEVLFVVARLDGPDVGEGASVLLREGRGRLGLLEILPQIGRE